MLLLGCVVPAVDERSAGMGVVPMPTSAGATSTDGILCAFILRNRSRRWFEISRARQGCQTMTGYSDGAK
jgi:hypothetical protein